MIVQKTCPICKEEFNTILGFEDNICEKCFEDLLKNKKEEKKNEIYRSS